MQPLAFTAHRSRMFDPSHAYDCILVPIDLAESSHAAVRTALELKRRNGSTVVLFLVADSAGNNAFLSGNGESWTLADVCEQGLDALRSTMEEISPNDVDHVLYDVVGSVEVVRGVINAANRHNATLVILGVDAASDHAHVFRSRSEKIAQGLDCSVMMVHPREPAKADR